LKESQQRKIEGRLAEDGDLRELLENLRKTKSLIGWLPRVSAPRNFTLTPEMVPVRRKKQPLLTTMRWATSLAAVLMVILVSVEFVFGNMFLASQSQKSVSLMDEAAFAAEATPEPLIIWGAPGVGGAGRGAGDDALESEMQAAEEPMMEMQAPQEESAEAPSQLEEETEEEIIPPAESEEGESLDVTKPTGESPILGINTDQGGEDLETTEDASPKASPFANLSLIRWAEIALAVIAVGGGITLLILRKR
jgi:hypothetical protein